MRQKCILFSTRLMFYILLAAFAFLKLIFICFLREFIFLKFCVLVDKNVLTVKVK